MKKLLAASATALLAGAAVTVPAWAAVNRPHSVTVFHDRDMIVAEGYEAVGRNMLILVKRNGVEIGQAEGPTVETAGGPGFEVNHGPLGDAQPGDCFERTTPDILPGDVVEVYYDGAVTPETTETRDVSLAGDPTEVTPLNQEQFPGQIVGDIVLKGSAVAPGGGQLPVGELAEEVRDLGTRFRSEPDTLDYDGATATTFTAVYRPPFLNNVVKPGSTTTEDQMKNAILGGGHSVVWANGALTETTISELGEPGGPAPGCEAAPAARNAMTEVTPGTVNARTAGGNVTVGGVVQDGINVALSVNDGALTDAVAVDRTNRTWTAAFPAGTLNEGNNSITASFSGDGAPTQPQSRTIVKDTQAPAAPTSTPPADRVYNAPVSVDLGAETGAKISYTKQAAPAQPDVAYTGPITVSASQTIRAIAVDKAGNASPEASFAYRVDTVAPLVPGIDLVAASDTGSSNADNRTNDSTPTFAGHTEPGVSVRLFVDGAVRGSGVADAGGNYGITSSALPNGVHAAVVEARDGAGNTSRSAALSVNVDLLKPTVVGRSPAANAVGRAVGTNVTATFNEPVTGVNGVTFKLRRGTVNVPAVVGYNAGTRVATLNPNASLARNTLYTATLSSGIRDSAGNALAPVSWSFRTAR